MNLAGAPQITHVQLQAFMEAHWDNIRYQDIGGAWELLESRQNDLKKNAQHILTQFFVLTTANNAEPVNIHEACQKWP